MIFLVQVIVATPLARNKNAMGLVSMVRIMNGSLMSGLMSLKIQMSQTALAG